MKTFVYSLLAAIIILGAVGIAMMGEEEATLDTETAEEVAVEETITENLQASLLDEDKVDQEEVAEELEPEEATENAEVEEEKGEQKELEEKTVEEKEADDAAEQDAEQEAAIAAAVEEALKQEEEERQARIAEQRKQMEAAQKERDAERAAIEAERAEKLKKAQVIAAAEAARKEAEEKRKNPTGVEFHQNGRVTVGLQNYTVEVANTVKRQQTGLMYREEMEAHRGMFFVFPEEGDHGIYMKNTLIPLDVIWIGEDRIVKHVETLQPCTTSQCPVTRPDEPAMYVLEVNAGTFKGKVGDKIAYGNIPRFQKD